MRIFICYSDKTLVGHLNGDNHKEVMKKVKLYNKHNKTKIVRFKDPIYQEVHTV